jgi:transposase
MSPHSRPAPRPPAAPSRKRGKSNHTPLPPIWRVPDALWALVEPLLAQYDPPAATGRQRIDQRETLDATISQRPEPAPEFEPHLALDRGYDTPDGWEATVERDYEPHIPPQRGPRAPRRKRHPPRRWVVERTLAWLHQCRGLLIRWEKKADNYLGLIQVACILLWFRRLHRLAERGHV